MAFQLRRARTGRRRVPVQITQFGTLLQFHLQSIAQDSTGDSKSNHHNKLHLFGPEFLLCLALSDSDALPLETTSLHVPPGPGPSCIRARTCFGTEHGTTRRTSTTTLWKNLLNPVFIDMVRHILLGRDQGGLRRH